MGVHFDLYEASIGSHDVALENSKITVFASVEDYTVRLYVNEEKVAQQKLKLWSTPNIETSLQGGDLLLKTSQGLFGTKFEMTFKSKILSSDAWPSPALSACTARRPRRLASENINNFCSIVKVMAAQME